MSKLKFDSLRILFGNSTPSEQWAWLVANRKQASLITLDNDETFIQVKGEDDDELIMKSDCGDREGAKLLLEALGFEVEYV